MKIPSLACVPASDLSMSGVEISTTRCILFLLLSAMKLHEERSSRAPIVNNVKTELEMLAFCILSELIIVLF